MEGMGGHDTMFGTRSGRVFFAIGKPDGNP